MSTQTELETIRQRVSLVDQELVSIRALLTRLEQRLAQSAEPSGAGTSEPASPAATYVASSSSAPTQVEESPGFRRVPPPLPSFSPEQTSTSAPGPRPALESIPVAASVPPELPSEPPQPTPAVAREPKLRLWLQRLQLWPPAEDGSSAEVRLGAWWATRLGALFAVIGVVFFGVYLSGGTPPWVKLIELLLVAVGVTGGGWALERRIPRFGAVVFGAGLSLLYFSAFAAYAVEPVKVIESRPVAVVWQWAAVGLLVAAALWRRSPVVATVGVGFGFVTAVFSYLGNLDEIAVWTAALLALGAVVLDRLKRWSGPAWLALPCSYLIYGCVIVGHWSPGTAPHRWLVWGGLAGLVSLFFARDWPRRQRDAHEEKAARPITFQSLNTSLAALVGLTASLWLFRPFLAEFYFGAGGLLGGLMVLRWRSDRADALAAVLLAKAAGALTLGVIEVSDGRTTAIALLVQAWIMVFSAQRLGSRVLAGGSGLVTAAAVGYFAETLVAHASLVHLAWQIAFVAGLSLLGTEAVRRLPPLHRGASAGPEWPADSSAKAVRSSAMEAGAGTVAGLLAVASVLRWEGAANLTVGTCVAVATFFGLLAAGRRAWGPAVVSGIALGAAHVLWLGAWVETWGGTADTVSMAALAGLSIGGVVTLRRLSRRWPATADLATFLAWLTCTGVVVGAYRALGAEQGFLVSALLGLLLAGLSPQVWRLHLPWLACWTALLAAGLWRHGQGGVSGGLTPIEMGARIMGILTFWAVPIGQRWFSRWSQAEAEEPRAGWIQPLQLAAPAIVTHAALSQMLAGPRLALTLTLIGSALVVVAKTPRVKWAWESALAFVVLAIGALPGRAEPPVLLCLLSLALLAWVPVVFRVRFAALREDDDSVFWTRRAGVGFSTVFATVLSAMALVRAFDGADLVWAWSGLIVGVGLLGTWLHQAAPRRAASILVWAGAVLALGGLGLDDSDSRREALLGPVIFLALLAALLPLWFKRVDPVRRLKSTGQLEWWFGGLALLLLLTAFRQQTGFWQPFVTVGWGVSGVALFLIGLFARARSHRLLGLIGLALCVPRVFLVDIDSALFRIAAFVVLGVVLLWVGFSYHRFRHLIADDRDVEDRSSDEPPQP